MGRITSDNMILPSVLEMDFTETALVFCWSCFEEFPKR